MGRNISRRFRYAAGAAIALALAAPPLLAQQTPPAQPAEKQAEPDDSTIPSQRRQGAASRRSRDLAPAESAAAAPGETPAGSATVDIAGAERIIVTGMVPVPNVGNGAPYHSPEELAAMAEKTQNDIAHTNSVDTRTRLCRLASNPPERLSMNYPSIELLMDREIETGKRLVTEADRAKAATDAALKARRDAADHKIEMKVVEDAELARQDAVNKVEAARIKYLEAGAAIADFQDFERQGYVIPNVNAERAPSGRILTWGELDTRALRRSKAGYWQGVPVPDPAPGLHIEKVEAHQNDDGKRSIIRITGELKNDRDKSASIPDLNVVALDKQGFVLVANPIDASGSQIPPQSSRPFAYELKPAPDNIARIAVTFASSLAPPPRTYLKAPPGCDGAAAPD